MELSEQNTYAYNAAISYVEGESLSFKDFTLTFIGIHDLITDDGIKVSLQTTDFLVVSNSGESITLKIGNGQLPNPPHDFSLGGKTFTLFTGEGPDSTVLKGSLLVVIEKQ